jgi:DamX protein
MAVNRIKLEKYVDLSEQSERMQSFYGLKYDPFGALVDAMVFSGAGGRYEIAETIRHLLTYSPQDGLVIGPIGSGKRMLTQHVLKMLEDHWRIAWLDGSEVETTDELLKEIVGQLGLGLKVEPDADSMVAQINQVIAERAESGEAFLLVIQYADQLVEPLLALAARFRTPSQLETRLRQLWLVESDESISGLHEDDWFSYPLNALSDDDAALYLKDRLVAAGNVGDLPFTPKDIIRLNQMSKGSLLALNELARDYLIGTTFRTAEKTKGFPITHMIAGIAALTIVSIALLYNLNEKKGAVTQVELTPTTEPLSSVQQKLADAAAKIEAKTQQVTETPELVSEQGVAPNPVANSQAIEVVEPSEVGAGATGTAKDETVPVKVESANAALAPKSEAATNLLARAKDAQFTMQLIGVHDRNKLNVVVQEFSEPNLVDIVETTYEGKPWYVLIYGQFDSKIEAQNAVGSLPKSFEKQTPWIRTFSAIRKTAEN